MSLWLSALLVLLLALLTLVSYVDRLYHEMGKFLSREFQENIDAYELHVEPRLGITSERASLSMAVLTQLCTASIGVLIGYMLFQENRWVALDLVQAAVSLIFIVVIFNRLLPHIFFVRTRGEWLTRFVPVLRIFIYVAMPVTMILGFALSVASLTKEHAEQEPEHPSEAVDALRSIRRRSINNALQIAAADPLNLAGIIVPGPRISPLAGQSVDLLIA